MALRTPDAAHPEHILGDRHEVGGLPCGAVEPHQCWSGAAWLSATGVWLRLVVTAGGCGGCFNLWAPKDNWLVVFNIFFFPNI